MTTPDGAGSPRSLRTPAPTVMHPSTELVLLGCALLLVYGVASPVVPASVLVLSCLGAVLSTRVRFARWLAALVVLAGPMLIMVGIIQGLFYPGEAVTVLWQAGPAALTVEGLAVAAQLWLRVAAMIALCALLAFASNASRVFDGLVGLRLPLSVAYICATAMTLVPLIRRRTSQALDSRAARGWATDRWTIRVRLLPGILAGLLTTSLVQLDQRHDALVQRGFGRHRHPTPARTYRKATGERALRWAAPVLSVALVTASLTDVLALPSASDLLEVLRG